MSAVFLWAQDVNVVHHDAPCGMSTGEASAFPGAGFGEGPFTYIWSPDPPVGQGTNEVSGLPPGNYSVLVTDENGVSATGNVTIVALPGLGLASGDLGTVMACQEPCAGALTVNFGGQSPYSLVSDPPGIVEQTVMFSSYLTGACAGTEYAITVTDANGCMGSYTMTDVVFAPQPELVGEVIRGSCVDGATGSMELWFSQPVDLLLEGPSPTINPIPTNTYYLLEDLLPGEYTLFGFGLNHPCQDDTVFLHRVVPEITLGCGVIEGTAFVDLDNDCVPSDGDVLVPGASILLQPGPVQPLLTGQSGDVVAVVDEGDYTLSATMSGLALTCGLIDPVTVDLANGETVYVEFAFVPTTGPDVIVSHTVSEIRPGFEVHYWVEVRNVGPFLVEGLIIDLGFDPLFGFVEASLLPSGQSQGSITWSVVELQAYQTFVIDVVLLVPADPDLIGVEVDSESSVISDTAGEVSENNHFSSTDPIIGAYDPNDKRGFTSSRSSDDIYWYDTDEFVDFVVRFQNTGTAAAVNVVIVDTISALFDPVSLELLGSSHEMIVNWRPGNALEFAFPMIMLPDSGADESASHGYVKFRLKPKADISVGSFLTNSADIYFDFNPPIRTNTVILHVEEPVGVVETKNGSIVFIPNPATDILQVATPGIEAQRYEVLGLDGRLMRSARMPGSGRSFISLDGLDAGSYRLMVFDRKGLAASGQFVKL